MSREIADSQVELGSHLYLFLSPNAATTDCLIMGHGGHVAGERFKVPLKTTVYFALQHGGANRYAGGPIKVYDGQNFQHSNPAGEHYGAGRPCPDQILGKAHGDHWKIVKERGCEEYYLAIRERMTKIQAEMHGAWLPHFITIRNRKLPFMKQNVWLSRVIQLTQERYPNVVNFYSLGCRMLENDDELKKVGSPAFRDL